MTVREVVLPAERLQIERFLSRFGLKYENNIDRTLYMEENGEVIATLSASKYILKCLAIAEAYRSEKLAVTLVSEMIKRLHADGIYHYRVFTKPEYCGVFKSLGFGLLLETEKFSALAGGEGGISDAIGQMRVQMKFSLGIDSFGENSDTACIVLNGNPFTEGHLKLAEYAAARHKFVLVFVLEEEGSLFSFKERFAMAYLALKPRANVLVLPSSMYIVSKATFPGYFLKTLDETTEEYAKYDALLFRKYFMPELGIVKRYVGEETSGYMRLYNEVLGRILGDKLEVVPRFKEDGEVISASAVRSLLAEGKTEEALKFIPRSNYAVFKSMIINKNV